MRPVTLAVLALLGSKAAAAQAPAIVSRAPVDSSAEVAFHALLTPASIYVGQQASYQVGVFIASDVRARLRRNPEFIPPELRAMLGYDLSSATPYTRVVSGRRYEVHVFERAIFPLIPGRHAIAPARLSYSLPLTTSFFSREESRTLRAESLTVVVQEPPLDGRPAEYAGAVGTLTLEREVEGTRRGARVGIPLVVTLRLSGVGNVAMLPRPELQVAWAQVVNGSERVQLDTAGPLVRGHKEFDYIVTPAQSGRQRLPQQRYTYFDPYAARYALAVAAELEVDVAPGTIVATTSAEDAGAPPLTIRRTFRGALPEPVSSRTAFWLLLAAMPLPAAGVALVRRSRRRNPVAPATQLRVLTLRTASGDPAAIRRALTKALGERLQIEAATLADPRRIERALRRRGVTRATAQRTAQLHSELDAAVFGAERQPVRAGLAAEAAAVFEAVDQEATRRPLWRRAGAMYVLATFAAGTLALAIQPDSASRVFARGVDQYEAGAYHAAQETFLALARALPRAADAWANAGTSAWQARDTAAAAVAWQRALRLDPRDHETRARLDDVPAFRPGWLGDVPPVPVALVAWLGFAAWAALWALQPVARPWARRGAMAALVLAAASLAVGVRLEEIARGRDTAVLLAAERLRQGPSLGADAGEPVMPGETVRLRVAEGAWRFIRLTDGRAGWVPAERLESLDTRRPPRR